MGLTLREVRDEDLPLLFEQWADPVAVHRAAFTAPDHMERDAFERRWSRLRADETVLARVVVVDDEVAGTIGSWGESGEREVTYWIGRSYWGKGIATDALKAFLAVERSRPLRPASRPTTSRPAASSRSAASASSRQNETSLKRAQPRSRNSCCGSTSSRPRNRDPAVEPGKPRQGSRFEWEGVDLKGGDPDDGATRTGLPTNPVRSRWRAAVGVPLPSWRAWVEARSTRRVCLGG
jgi:Acetyltransferase (GNAT) domain